MIVESLSFKLILDFLQYLKKNRITLSNIKITFYDRVNHESITFKDVDEVSLYFKKEYNIIDNNILGSLCSVELFNGISNLYDFTTEYMASNITGAYKLKSGSQYDRERNSQRSILTNRQISFIDLAIKDYLKFYNEIKRIYITGIYSPCYAQPGWSQNTWYINSLKNAISPLPPPNNFPYNKKIITKDPPS